jgi:hypothetical protein
MSSRLANGLLILVVVISAIVLVLFNLQIMEKLLG